MKKSKIAVLVAMVVVLAFSLAACGGSDKSSSDKTVYKVGTEPTFPPFDTTDEDQNIVGLDMDLIKAIGEDQGFDVEFENLSFDGLIPALKAGNIDIVAAGMNKDDEDRQKEVDFSDSYYESKLFVAVTEDNTTIKSVEDLTPDMKVAAQTGTTGASKVKELKDAGKIKEAVILDGHLHDEADQRRRFCSHQRQAGNGSLYEEAAGQDQDGRRSSECGKLWFRCTEG